MTLLTLFKFLNASLCLANAVILFMPKKPMSGVHSNAAGIIALVALAMIIAVVVQAALTIAGWYYGKLGMLIGLFIVMVPLSLLMWYFLLWM